MVAYHHRKRDRESYWAAFVKKELASLVLIAWYIKVELIRTAQLPPYMTMNQISRHEPLQRDIDIHAKIVYDNVYRDKERSKFILCNHTNEKLNGKMGVITSYVKETNQFDVMISQNRYREEQSLIKLKVLSEHMEPVKQLHRRFSNDIDMSLIAKVPKYELRLKSHFHSHSDPVITFRDEAYNQIENNIWPQLDNESPASQASGAEKLTAVLFDIDQKEKEEHSRKEMDRQRLRDGVARMVLTQTPSRKSAGKRSSRCGHTPVPSKKRALQLHSVWKARIEHCFGRNTEDQVDCSEDGTRGTNMVFTFPFQTTDNSLSTCSRHISTLSESVVNDSRFKRYTGMKTIIIDDKAVGSLSPTVDINDDLFDFLLCW